MKMLIPGLVSVTFRRLSTREIVQLAAKAGLYAIEWGGDVHVPPGNFALAREVRKQTTDYGLVTASYGSYYRAGYPAGDWDTVLNTAEILGAPNIRIWAGEKGSAESDSETRARVVEDIRYVVRAAAYRNINVSLEYHGGTLTDTLQSTMQLIEEVNDPDLRIYWQPAVKPLPNEREAALQSLLKSVSHTHVFQWVQGTSQRLALADGQDEWLRYLKILASTGRQHALLMEFVKDDSPEQFLVDAAVMKQWIASVEG